MLEKPQWRKHSEWRGWIDTLLAKNAPTYRIYDPDLLRPQDIDALLAKNNQYVADSLASFLMKKLPGEGKPAYPEYADPKWIRDRVAKIMAQGHERAYSVVIEQIASDPKWRGETEWIGTIIKAGGGPAERAAETILSKPESAKHPEWLVSLLSRELGENDNLAQLDDTIDRYVLSQPHWKSHPEVLKIGGGKNLSASELRLLLADPNDPKPLFQRAMSRSLRASGQSYRKFLESLSSDQLKNMALFPVSFDHNDSSKLSLIRADAQRILVERKDPRLTDWLAQDLVKTADRAELLTVIGAEKPEYANAVVEAWRKSESLKPEDRGWVRHRIMNELSEAEGKVDRAVAPLIFSSTELSEKSHPIRYTATKTLQRMDITNFPAARAALLRSLEDESETIRGMAVGMLETLGESSPAYRARLTQLAKVEKSFFAQQTMQKALARLDPAGACSARFDALAP